MQTVPLDQSVAMIPDGASLMIGGFMGVGSPERVIDEIVRQNRGNLTVIANDTAAPGRGIGKLIGKGATKIVKQYTLPITSLRPVDLVVTELAVIAFRAGRATTLERGPGVSVAQVIAATEAELEMPKDVPEMAL